MNPAFVIILILGCIVFWFLASALFKPIGRLLHKIGKDAIDELTNEEKEKDVIDELTDKEKENI